MKQVKRRVWSILLACVMLLTMLPAGAWAADEAQEVGTAAELIQAFSAGGEIRLKNDITVNNADTFYPLTLVKDVSATLDLNQHTLTLKSFGPASDYDAYNGSVSASIQNRGSLTVKNGTIEGTAADARLIVNHETGTLILEDDVALKNSYGNAVDNLGGSVTSSADVTAENKYSAIVTYGGSVTIEGGAIEGYDGLDCL